MKAISFLLMVSILSGSVPVNLVFAAERDSEETPILAQFFDIFSSEKNKSNVEELGSLGDSNPIDQPKLTTSDKISSWWDGVVGSVSNLISNFISPNVLERSSGSESDLLKDSSVVAPVPVKDIAKPADKVSVPVLPSKDIPEENLENISDGDGGQSRTWAVLKTGIVSAAVGLTATAVISLASKTVFKGGFGRYFAATGVSYIGTYLSGPVSVITTGSSVVLLSGATVGAVVGGLTMYHWGKDGVEPPFFVSKDTARKFRATVDDSYENFINLFTLSNKQVDLDKPNKPSAEDMLINAGALQPKVPVPVKESPKTSPFVSAPAASTVGDSFGLSGTFDITYSACPDTRSYHDDWLAKLSRKSDASGLVYSGYIQIVDFETVGTVTVSWNEASGKWTANLKGSYAGLSFKVSNVSVSENLSQGKISGSVSVLSPALEVFGEGSCSGGSGTFSGLIVR